MESEAEEYDVKYLIEKQYEFSEQVKLFCYHLFGRFLPENLTGFSENGETAQRIINDLNPNDINYLRYIGIQEEKEIDENMKEYVLLLKYNGEYILTGCTVVYQDGGWQLSSLSAENLGFSIGEVQ